MQGTVIYNRFIWVFMVSSTLLGERKKDGLPTLFLYIQLFFIGKMEIKAVLQLTCSGFFLPFFNFLAGVICKIL